MADANAYGVPVISINHYGPKTIVRDGVNGFLFEKSNFIQQGFLTIQKLTNNYDSYLELAHTSYQEYVDRLNWNVSVRKLKKLILDNISINNNF